MHILRKYTPFYAPDDGGTQAADLAAVVDPAIVADPAIPDSPADPDPEPAPAPRRTDPLIGTITGLRAKNRDLEGENARLAREAADARALAERLTRGGAPEAPPAPARTDAATADDAEIDRRAAQRVFLRDAQTVSELGLKTYGQGWADAINGLNAYGVNDSDFVSSVMEIAPGRVHEIMYAIAQDPERAIALANMTPARRIAEITRISMAATATAEKPAVEAPAVPAVPAKPAAVKTVSKAPAPPPPVEPSTSKVVDWRQDDASDAEFDRGFNEMMKKRSARR